MTFYNVYNVHKEIMFTSNYHIIVRFQSVYVLYIVQAERLSLSLKSFCFFEKKDIVADMTICGWVCSPRKGLARAAVLTTLCCNGPSLTLSKAGHCLETIFDFFLQGISQGQNKQKTPIRGLGNPTSPKGAAYFWMMEYSINIFI